MDHKQVLREAQATSQRARRALRKAKDLLDDCAPPATTKELARWTGMSEDFIRKDEHSGVVKGIRTARGGRLLFGRVEAVRYLQQMGVL